MRGRRPNERAARGGAWGIAAALVFACAPQVAAQPSRAPAGPMIPPATIDDALDVTGDSLAASTLRNRLALPVTVNGKGPFRFIVDSGADRTVIGATLALRLGLPAEGRVMLHSVTGSQQVDTVRIDTLRVGGSTIEGIVAPALLERNIGAQGLIGIDALADQRLMMDFDAKTIVVQDSRTPVRALPDEIVVTARRRHGQLIITRAYVGTQRVMALIDSGSEITAGNLALRDRLFRDRSLPAAEMVDLIGVTGERMKLATATLREVRIGGLTLRDVPIAFGDLTPFRLFGLTDQPALLLGTDVLEVFRRVSLDFGRRSVRFQVRRH